MTDQVDYFTKATGAPVECPFRSLTAGPNGPLLMQDVDLVEKIQSFTREKIPARNVHALGSGAYGTFTVKNDISKYSCAKVFKKGTKTDIFVRMSGIFTEQGDAETFRDPRGFSIKFYTPDGIWDLLTINTPVFNARDMKVGPDGVHAFKRDPRTGLWNPDQTWDFVNNHPEALFQMLMLYSDEYGTPASYRTMNTFGCNTYSLLNDSEERFWVKFHLTSENGLRGLTMEQSKLLAGEDPNFLSHDLYNAIKDGNYPRWKMSIQVMPEKDGYENSIAFDCTKVWCTKKYPLMEIGTIELNRNPTNYFSEVEQAAFSPANIVPGIGFSPDKLLQGRLLLYEDAQNYRIGANYKQIPINRPQCPVNTLYYGGAHQQDMFEKFPIYFPSAYKEVTGFSKRLDVPIKCDGPADYYELKHEGSDMDYYEQPRAYYESLDKNQRHNLAKNIGTTLTNISSEVSEKSLTLLKKISMQLHKDIQEVMGSKRAGAQRPTDVESIVQNLKVQLTV